LGINETTEYTEYTEEEDERRRMKPSDFTDLHKMRKEESCDNLVLISWLNVFSVS
jgi:hypothetical protein